MSCVVCISLLRALRRGGGDGGESEVDVTEMIQASLDPSFCCVGGEGKTRRVRGGRGVFWARDVEGQGTRSAGRCPRVRRSCHTVYAYM